MRSLHSDENVVQRMDQICQNLESYVREANEQGRHDSPARYFHLATISRLRNKSLKYVFDDNLFFEYLYATLATWGMDSRGAKLNVFENFVRGIRDQREEIIKLNTYNLALITGKNEEIVTKVALDIWNIIQALGVSKGKSQLVAGSKTLHHLLPDLVPPIDRKFTLRFFFDRSSIINAKSDCVQVFINYVYMFDVARNEIMKVIGDNPLNSSVTKVIDNAIIAYQSKGKSTIWTS